MSMVVQHNLQAMNANRLLGVTTGQQAKSTEKLSSGFKINRAADDAAGLTISEKMRKQIRGLNKASTNAQDGVSAVQTSEGALTEVHSMLQRMNELAVQASNGTNSQNDRDAIQAEIEQLTTEIDRVAETTKFNEIYLLKGDKAAGTKTEYMKAHDAGIEGTLVDKGKGKAEFTMKELNAGDSINIGGKAYKIIADGQKEAAADDDYKYTEAKGASASFSINGWTTNNNSAVKIGNMAAAIDGTAAADADALVTKLNADTGFNADYTASLSEDKKTLIITAKDLTKSETDVADAIDNTNTKVGNTAVADADITAEAAVEASFERKENVKFYAENSAEELTDEQALKELENGKKLFTTPGTEIKQTEADVKYTEAKGASASFSINGWTTTNASAVKIGNMAAAIDGTAAADADALVTKLNADTGFNADYTASLSEDKKTLIITAKDLTKSETDVADAIDNTNTKVNNTAVADANITAEAATEASYETKEKELYAKNGTKALTDEEILTALENGETLYSGPAERADNEITAKEAYALAKEELLKANQIGDTRGTAAVKNAVKPAGESEEKAKAEDFKTGDKVTIGDKEYTIGSKSADVDKILDEIEAVEKAGTANTAIKISFKNDKGDQEWTITPNTGAGTAAQIQQTKTDGAATTTTAAYADIKAALAKNPGLEITIDSTRTDLDGKLGKYMIADDDTEGSSVISADKAAELKNAEGTEAENVFEITTGSSEVAKTLSFNLHVGADADMNNKIQVDIDTMNSAFLGIKDINLSDPTGMDATYAIDAIADAISKVSAQRSALGAIQNRLEHTIANLDNVAENTTSAESRIRDTDMAQEMVEYSKNNILGQAGQAMLAQANQSTQGVLSLLG